MIAVKNDVTTLRPFAGEDYPAWAELHKAIYPEFPTSEADLREDDRMLSEGYFRERWMAERDGRIVGWATVQHTEYAFDPDRYSVSINVHPEYEGRGIGSELYSRVLRTLEERGAREAMSQACESRPRALRFLEDRGFVAKMRDRMSILDLDTVDFARWEDAGKRVEEQGILIRSVDELKGDPERNRKLYELDITVSADMPSVKPMTPPTFENYCRRVFESRWLLPEAFLVALDGDRYVGTTALWLSDGDEALYTGLTGVLREYRNRGIATALKVRCLRWAKESGRRYVKTFNESNNRKMLGINEALGFVAQPEYIQYLKVF
jgi:GNAT superfamily N-acetyltransferase